MRLNKGIPVRFTKNDKYKFIVDTTDWTNKQKNQLRVLLEAMNVDWTEGYFLGVPMKEGKGGE